uniref:Uncharacterized protein n=1 Tax=Arundo donax TaxID=35708 RepID=A0A0A9F5K2_ARUDO
MLWYAYAYTQFLRLRIVIRVPKFAHFCPC